MVASGNDFVITEIKNQKSKIKNFNNLAREICNRKYAVGADGLLVLEKSEVADVSMRIFNADGSEAEMCGNGARCAALFMSHAARRRSQTNIETKAGIIRSELNADNVKIKLTNPKDIKLDISIKVNNRRIKVNFINTGVPHAVIFVEGLERIRVAEIGKAIRYHHKFYPQGTNVDFVEALRNDLIAIRTYERGVEDETLACGTGAVASALIFALKTNSGNSINVRTKGEEILRADFLKANNNFSDVWLGGKAAIVYKGEYYV